jgi:hypothetical protein
MALNVELLKKVRDAIADEKNPVGFRMDGYFFAPCDDEWDDLVEVGDPSQVPHLLKTCGTAACIAGHVVALGPRYRGTNTFDGLAQKRLGLTQEDAFYLFQGEWSEHGWRLEDITREETVAYLDECIAAGEIVRR